MRELVTIGDLPSLGPTMRQRLRRASYLRVVPMGSMGQTNPNFSPGADSNNGGADLQQAAVDLLNYFDTHGVPSEHVSDQQVEDFQITWNADPANAAASAKLAVDGGYGPNVHDALNAMVGGIAPAVNTGAAPAPNKPAPAPAPTPGVTPAPTPAAPAKAGMGTAGVLFLIAAVAAGAYLLLGRKKSARASVVIHRNPRGGRRHRRRML